MRFDGKSIIDDIKKRGWIWDASNNTFYPPNSMRGKELIENGIILSKNNKIKPRALKRIKTGWIDDTLNIKNKSLHIDNFIRLVTMETGLCVWPEFYFLTDKQYRFDYAIPLHTDGSTLKIALECDGGIWMRGGGAHSRPQNIERDIDKSTRAAVNGWTLIRRTPTNLCTIDTINLINKAIETISRTT
jgi:hypothetical protein